VSSPPFANSSNQHDIGPAMTNSLPDYSNLRPAGGKRSSKRDRILNIFLQQKGHLSADDLFDHVRHAEAGIGRATVYRTLQWMVDAGIARKVDFGEGRSRYEPSYRHPRHFHLVCTQCHRSSEFLSSDVESLMEEVAAARGFTTSRSVLQIFGTCEECRTGRKAPPIDGATTELVFARDALRMAIATERSGLEFYTRAAALTRDPRGRTVFNELAAEERHHLGVLEERYRELAKKDPQLESRPTFLFFKGAANGLFEAGSDQLRRGVNDAQALLIGIKCERGSHRFFKRYGERFEDSEGKQVFLEFAAEERAHLDLLIREYRALRQRQGRRRPHPATPPMRPKLVASAQSAKPARTAKSVKSTR
jgi:Fur family transcriptional regulator, ferric uptake regulator